MSSLDLMTPYQRAYEQMKVLADQAIDLVDQYAPLTGLDHKVCELNEEFERIASELLAEQG